MSLLSNYIAQKIIKSIEQEFIFYAPELQKDFLKEASDFIELMSKWINQQITKEEVKNEKS